MLAAVFGGIGGPLAYYAGMRFGALDFPGNVWASLVAVGIEWAIACPAVFYIAVKIDRWKERLSSGPEAVV